MTTDSREFRLVYLNTPFLTVFRVYGQGLFMFQ